MIEGKLVSLRPIERDDLQLVQAWETDPQVLGEFNSFGMQGRQGLEAGFTKEGFLSPSQGMLLVIDNKGEPVGIGHYRQVLHGPPHGGHAFTLGTHLVPASRGKGYGVEVAELLAGYLLDTYPVVRIEAETDVENLPAQRVLEKAGFTREGVLRSAQWRAGDWHDLVLYSKLRGE